MIEFLVYIGFGICLCYYKIKQNKIINAFTIIMTPYVVILFLNNHIANKYGFYGINDDTQFMLLLGIAFFFVGTFFCMLFNKKFIRWNKETITDLQMDNSSFIRKCVPYIMFVLFVRIIQLIILYSRYGLAGLMKNDFELLLTRGIVSHLLLSIFPFMPILFYLWIINKKRNNIYILLYSVYMALAFIETEKAQVLSLVIATFIYCIIKNSKYFIKGILILLGAVCILFISNYVIKLTLQNMASGVSNDYYTYRLWNYIAGGLINSNYITSNSDFVSTNAFDYFLNCVLALPNMFIKEWFGVTIGPDVYSSLPYISSFKKVTFLSGYRYQDGNVVSAMTMMYGNGNLVAFACVCILWGWISERIYEKMIGNGKDFSDMFFVCYISFSFLSFFGSYYTLSSFYERLIWCAIIWPIMSRIRILQAKKV